MRLPGCRSDDPEAEGYEACDDGNTVDQDACRNDCRLARCGDGILRTDLSEGDMDFERCDDGNFADDDACVGTCVPAVCGDGFVHIGGRM